MNKVENKEIYISDIINKNEYINDSLYNIDILFFKKSLSERNLNYNVFFINQENDDKYTPLMCLIEDNANIKIIKKLIELGANVNSKNKYGYNILMISCMKKNYEIVKLLLENNVLIDDNDNDVDDSYDYYDDNLYNKYNFIKNSALILSIKNLEITTLLIKYNANVNYKNLVGQTTLIHACINNNINIIKLLLENDTDINIKNNSYNTAMNYLCSSCENPKIIEDFVLLGANINNVNSFGNTPIYGLCNNVMDLNDKIKLIKLFISKGCNVNNKNIYGRSIINNAILFPYFSIDIFKLLAANMIKIIKYILKSIKKILNYI